MLPERASSNQVPHAPKLLRLHIIPQPALPHFHPHLLPRPLLRNTLPKARTQLQSRAVLQLQHPRAKTISALRRILQSRQRRHRFQRQQRGQHQAVYHRPRHHPRQQHTPHHPRHLALKPSAGIAPPYSLPPAQTKTHATRRQQHKHRPRQPRSLPLPHQRPRQQQNRTDRHPRRQRQPIEPLPFFICKPSAHLPLTFDYRLPEIPAPNFQIAVNNMADIEASACICILFSTPYTVFNKGYLKTGILRLFFR